MNPAANDHPRLAHLPVSIFAMVMGLSGLTLAWQKSAETLGTPPAVPAALFLLAAAVFVLLCLAYGTKLVRHPAAVAAELNHPVRLAFFPTISIGLILLATAARPVAPDLSLALWWSGTAAHLAFTLYVINAWVFHDRFQIQHSNPAWFIPVVGNILVPLAGVPHGHPEVSWFFFSLGLVFWPVLMTVIVYRLFFHPPLPAKLLPTLFILVAPPAVGFLSYVRLAGEIDAFARVLYYFGLFLTLFLAVQAPRFLRLRFFLSWWAYSFPVAAITAATLTMAHATGEPFLHGLAVALLALLSLLLAILFGRTALAVLRGEICVPEE
ncbi:MAG: SLAC1 anion channel family protein [Rhodocyclaceae bacterium]|nr:SLAC1 anion channel family protein [Rhodocyclaceae bacterium]